MAKDSYYFPHDYNARNDKKISALVKEFKSSGYGIFWATCEMMHEEGGEIELDDLTIHAIAKDLNEDERLVSEILSKCVEKYKLFTKQNEAERSTASVLQSNRIHRNLEEKNKKRNSKAEAGRLGGLKSGITRSYNKNDEAERSSASSNEAKESKVKEIKEIKESKENEKKEFNTMPLADHFNGLPTNTRKASYEIIFRTQQLKISDEDLNGMWEVFKIQNLTGKKWYANEDAVFSHFINWIKIQKFKENGKSTGSNITKFNAGANELLERGKAKINEIRNRNSGS